MPIRRTPSAWNAYSLSLIILLFAGCARIGESDSGQAPRLFVGTMEWGTEGGLFLTPCGETDAVRLHDPDGIVANAQSFVSVHTVPEGRDGSGGWTIVRPNYISREGFDCTLDWEGFLWRAAGNEPFWSAVLEEGRLSIRTPEEDPRTVPVRMVEERTFVSEEAGISLQFAPAFCRDTMADATYGYWAELTIQGRSMTGCGFRGLGASER